MDVHAKSMYLEQLAASDSCYASEVLRREDALFTVLLRLEGDRRYERDNIVFWGKKKTDLWVIRVDNMSRTVVLFKK